MNRIFTLVLLALLISGVAGAQSLSTVGPGMNLGVADSPIYGFVIPATQTYDLFNTATKIGTVPSGANKVWILAAYGNIVVGNASVTYSAGTLGGIPVASGAYLALPLRMDTRAPDIYMLNNSAGTTATVRLMYSK